ncbi:MAG: glycosyltransferase [Candidatus Omnitrophota bacterium]
MKTSLVIYTLNEIDGMRVIMPEIKKDWYDELIIFDADSSDGTIEYAKEHGYPIFIQKEKGAGAAFLESLQQVTGDIIIAFSPDGNSIPEKIPELVTKIKEGYDIVIASRYFKDAKSYDDNAVTAFGNHMFTWLINFLFGSNITDSLVMFRAYRKDALNKLHIDAKNTSCGTQILLRAIKKKLKIAEIPGDEPPRIGGKSKMSPIRNGLRELWAILKEFFIRG